MKRITISPEDRRFSATSITVGYLQENKAEKVEFDIPKQYENYGRKACFEADGRTFAKLFDNVTGNTITFTRDFTQYKNLKMTIAFFKTEDEDEIVARTSTLNIFIENAVICDDDIKPDDPKVVILDDLIERVVKLDETLTKNEEERAKYIDELQKKVNNGEFDGADFNYNWRGTELGVKNSKETEYEYTDLKGEKGEKGDKGDMGNVNFASFFTKGKYLYIKYPKDPADIEFKIIGKMLGVKIL